VDAIRARSSELENHLIDEYQAGHINRREFIRRGTVAGMSLSLVGFLAACGSGQKPGANQQAPQGKAQAGGTMRTGIISPAGALDPVTVNNEGGLLVLGQTGEYLAWSDKDLKLQPRLARSWKPNADGSVWTFKLRPGVKFHDGSPMEAEDVVATFQRLADPKNSSNALSNFEGVLRKSGVRKVDPMTVEFRLQAPNGNFPYIVSSDNYNAIILPRSYQGNWEKTFVGTGPWLLDKFTPNSGVSYRKNPNYWDKSRMPLLDRSEITFYDKEQAQILGLQGNQVDLLSHFSPTGGRALLTDPNVRVIALKSAVHREVHMRTDKEPFKDARVRRAVALLLNRDAVVQGLLEKQADLGNDTPFAPVYQSTVPLPQRRQDVEQAKALLAAAGKSGGFTTQLRTWDGYELPDYAQIIQDNLKPAGINLNLNITDSGSYYGDAVYGKSPWLDSVMGITEYGHRGVPNVYLGAPLRSTGTWNAAHFHNKQYDRLVDQYVAALDLQSQRAAAGKIERLLQEQTPILYAYFYYFLTGTKPNVTGVEVTAMGHLDLTKAGFTA
jgi:peptide/nickel transport system substrate-binding protein